MKKYSTSQSGLFNPRILFAFALCSVGALLAMLSFAAGTPTGGGAVVDRAYGIGGEIMSEADVIREAASSGWIATTFRAVMDTGHVPVASGEGTVVQWDAKALDLLPGPVATALRDLTSTVLGASRDVLGASSREAGTPILGQPLSVIKPDGVLIGPWENAVDASNVNLPVIYRAALSVAASLDRVLPVLRAYAATLPRNPSAAASECDVLDLSPTLCVAGTGANLHTSESMVLVDLGGDDRYENSAGGASATAADLFPVSVVVDLGGDDVYDHVIARDKPQLSQGAAYQGVGFLVDIGGDDTYVRRPGSGDGPGRSFQESQGSGTLGVGVLVDLGGGNDHYRVESYDGEISTHQGAGNSGVGLLLDDGGNDTFEIDGGTAIVRPGPDGKLQHVLRAAYGQGYGKTGGIGALVHLGDGAESFAATVASEVPPVFTDYVPGIQQGLRANAQAMAQGLGDSGTGLLLTGSGPSTYRVTATGTGLGQHFVYGQGAGGMGVGILDDLGGNDTYELSSDMQVEADAVADQSCACARADAVIDASGLLNAQSVAGQGTSGFVTFSNAGAVGLLSDRGGDDHYVAALRGEVRAVATTGESNQSAFAKAVSFNAANLRAQGASEVSGVGMLIDGGGDDTYEVEVHQLASAIADAANPSLAAARADAAARATGGADVLAQGVGAGDAEIAALLDSGGADAYSARLRPEAFAWPSPDGASEGPNGGTVQGSGPQGLLVDLDDGEDDSFVIEPNFIDVCVGNRGEAPGWVECPEALRPLGTGIVDSAAPKADTSITFDPAQADIGSSGAPLMVSGRVLGPSGAPVPEARVDIRLQQEASDAVTLTQSWHNLVGIHADTDAAGYFRAVLRVQDANPNPRSALLRLFTGYSGAPAARPSTVTMAFSLTGVQLNTVVSRKIHGSAGTFGVDLPLIGSPGIECRSGGANGDYTLVFTFTNTLTSVDSASVTSGKGSVTSSNIDSNDAHNYIVNLTGVTNAQVITVSLSNVNDSAGHFSSILSSSMGVLIGDTSANGLVNSTDISQTQAQSGQPVTGSNFRTDVSVNGLINSTDVSMVQSKSGTGLP